GQEALRVQIRQCLAFGQLQSELVWSLVDRRELDVSNLSNFRVKAVLLDLKRGVEKEPRIPAAAGGDENPIRTGITVALRCGRSGHPWQCCRGAQYCTHLQQITSFHRASNQSYKKR